MRQGKLLYDLDLALPALDGIAPVGVTIAIEIEPKDAGCILSGWLPDGNLQSFEFMGGRTEFTLPFAQPRILVKYLAGLRSLRIWATGYGEQRSRDRRHRARHSDGDARIDGS